MAAVTDSESSFPHSYTAPPPSASTSLNHIFLSPGHTVPATPSVSPISPLHIENTLVSPISVSLIPSPSHALSKIEPTSPQPQHTARSEVSHASPAFISALTTHPTHTHTARCQNTHPSTIGSSQPLIQVIMTTAVEHRCLPRRCELEFEHLCVFVKGGFYSRGWNLRLWLSWVVFTYSLCQKYTFLE